MPSVSMANFLKGKAYLCTWFVDGNVLKSWPTSVEKGVALWNEVRLKTILSFHVAYFISRAYTIK